MYHLHALTNKAEARGDKERLNFQSQTRPSDEMLSSQDSEGSGDLGTGGYS